MIYHWLGGERKYIMKTREERRIKRELKKVVKSWMRTNGYKKRYHYIDSSYRKKYIHMLIKNKYKNDNPEYMDFVAEVTSEGYFGEIKVTTYSLTKEGREHYACNDDWNEEYYTV
jgi:hypothetical protein